MTAEIIGGRGVGREGAGAGKWRDITLGDMTSGGIAGSAALHLIVLALILLGLPNLFRKPPLEDTPIAVQLVTIAPDTRATHANPFRPQPDAKPEPPRTEPAPIPEPKPQPPAPNPVPPPPAAAAPPPLPVPPPPKPEAKPAPEPAAASPPKPESKPTPPPPKPLEARAPADPPPLPERKPKPKPEQRVAQHAHAETKPEPSRKTSPAQTARAEPKPEPKKADPAAFGKLLQDLETREKSEKRDQPDAFDNLLKNLTRDQSARTEEPKPAPRRMASLSPPSSQPKAPLGAELTASEIDVVRQQLSRCWNIPAGARDAKDLVVAIRGTIAPDGRVLQATIVDQARLGDPFFRAAAESARRAFFHPLCTPLRLPPEKYESWKTFEIELSPKDIL
ncbi:MAG: hypothetical protein AB7H71_12440 [Alphaproteobacteria bacterium]